MASYNNTIGEVKLMIYEKLDIPPYKQDLYYKNVPLNEDEKTLFEYNVIPGHNPIKIVEIWGSSVYGELGGLTPHIPIQTEKFEVGFEGTVLVSPKSPRLEATTSSSESHPKESNPGGL
eukprot:TRINITY_DN7684_c0_g1_i1.p1 TRINITY_DN7684_c0_g1~~TRINITY_DN7684_c0_g1_i1.p1  ORF type:complete len:119 (+),score=27.58 TRINITY_DN7684_c0_g1_i1:171-527(+)